MPRHMSFSMTTDAVRDRSKTVTRRLGWWNLKPGTVLWACEKCQGLKKGEKVKRLALIRVVKTEPEFVFSIKEYGPSELAREGFPHLTAREFIDMCDATIATLQAQLAASVGPGADGERIVVTARPAATS